MLWNEPNNLSHWDRNQDHEWGLFAEMVGLAGERLGRVAPGLPRVLGGISPIDPRFIRNLFSRGIGSSIVSERLQAWAVDATLEHLVPHAERVFWYSLMDLPERWEAVTRHRGSEGSAYYRHFRMGLFSSEGRPKPAARALANWTAEGVGICEWVYWQEGERFDRMLRLLRDLGVKRVRT